MCNGESPVKIPIDHSFPGSFLQGIHFIFLIRRLKCIIGYIVSFMPIRFLFFRNVFLFEAKKLPGVFQVMIQRTFGKNEGAQDKNVNLSGLKALHRIDRFFNDRFAGNIKRGVKYQWDAG